MTTNVPRVSFGPTGFIAPTAAAILTGVQADINAAFGGGVNPALETPQGQLATSETAIIDNTNNMFCNITNQVDPAFADGRMQDAIARIYFLFRIPGQPTVVSTLCTGRAGTVIPAGALAKSTDGNTYACVNGGTIGGGGNVTLDFACTVNGPIACPVGALSVIYQAINGWDAITNSSDGALGRLRENRAEFEARRAASVAINSRGILSAVQAKVLTVPNVLDAYTTENDTGAPVTIGNVALDPYSLYVAVVGGDNEAVAQAIWTKKAPGCNYSGNTSIIVQDTNSGYDPPYPQYQVKFQRPTSLSILFRVEIQNSPQVPSNAADLIRAAIISAFAGEDGGQRARIGAKLLASRYVTPVVALGAWAQILALTVGSSNDPDASFTGVIAGTTLTVSSVTGVVAANQLVQDATGNIIEGTLITSGSGATWTVAPSQTVSSEAMTSTAALNTSVQVGIDQEPVISAAHILVVLT